MQKRIIIGLTSIMVLLAVAYLAVGYLVYNQLGYVAHSCDRHRPNRPDHFTNISAWPAMDFPAYFMDNYQEVRFPSRNPDWELSAWYVAGDPKAPAVILVDGVGSCKYTQSLLVPAGMLWRNGFTVLLLDLHDTSDSTIDDGWLMAFATLPDRPVPSRCTPGSDISA